MHTKCHFHKLYIGILYFFLLLVQAYGSDTFKRGQELFRSNKPTEALPYLIQASGEVAVNPLVFNYMGLCYYQLGQYDASIAAFLRGILIPSAPKPLLYYNAGNAAFAAGKYEQAVDLYTNCLQENSFFSRAFLNRGNAFLKLIRMDDSLNDYKRFLELDPENPQKEKINMMISLIESDLRLSQEQRRAAEQARVQAESEVRATEAAAALLKESAVQAQRDREAAEKARSETLARQTEEEARRRADEEKINSAKLQLLEALSNSLSGDSSNIQAGTEGVMDYDRKSTLE